MTTISAGMKADFSPIKGHVLLETYSDRTKWGMKALFSNGMEVSYIGDGSPATRSFENKVGKICNGKTNQFGYPDFN